MTVRFYLSEKSIKHEQKARIYFIADGSMYRILNNLKVKLGKLRLWQVRTLWNRIKRQVNQTIHISFFAETTQSKSHQENNHEDFGEFENHFH